MVRCWNIWLIDFPTFDTGGRPLCEKYTFKLYLNKGGIHKLRKQAMGEGEPIV